MKLYEQYLLSDKIIIHKPNLLSKSKIFIVGLSGSGKTTLGEYLAKKYNREFIKLDDWFWEIAEGITGSTRQELLDELIIFRNNRKKGNVTEEQLNKRKFNAQEINKLLEKRLRSYKGNAIFDGVQTLWYNRDWILSHPIIMMGTSVFTSSLRAMLRNRKEEWSKEWSWLDIIYDVYHNQNKFIDAVKKMRDDIVFRNDYIMVDSKEDIKL